MLLRNLKNWYKHDKRLIWVSIIIGFIVTICFTNYSAKAYSETVHSNLEQNLIRFHVIANSDSEEDQALKLNVRDKVLDEIEPLLNNSQNIQQSRQIILDKLDKLKQIAEDVIKQHNKAYKVEVNLEKVNFPTKKYGDIILPSGEYEALRIIIGNGYGKNWWCVMFPPLCFVDITHGVVPEETKDELKNVLDENEYNLITSVQDEKNIPIKIKFKIVEWWQENKGIKTIFAHNNRTGEQHEK